MERFCLFCYNPVYMVYRQGSISGMCSRRPTHLQYSVEPLCLFRDRQHTAAAHTHVGHSSHWLSGTWGVSTNPSIITTRFTWPTEDGYVLGLINTRGGLIRFVSPLSYNPLTQPTVPRKIKTPSYVFTCRWMCCVVCTEEECRNGRWIQL
jgi:hypothetical protein